MLTATKTFPTDDADCKITVELEGDTVRLSLEGAYPKMSTRQWNDIADYVSAFQTARRMMGEAV